MTIEELIFYRDEFNKKVLKHQKDNKKWGILTPLLFIIGVLLIIVPAMIIGDNNGQEKPLVFFVLVILGVLVILLGFFSLSIQIYHLVHISKNKNYRDEVSHELTHIVSKKETTSSKEFKFINK